MITLPPFFRCIKYIVNELVTNEEIYVKTLEQGIKNYVTPMADPKLSEYIREDGLKIFGNIAEIYEMHAKTLHPALVSCGYDVIKISETFDTLIANGHFYCYIPYTLNREQALTMSYGYEEFFKDRQKSSDGDRLGVSSFLLQPIQRLPRYKLLLAEMVTKFIKNRDKMDIKACVGALCKTEKNVDRLVNLVNESLSINEIASDGLVSASKILFRHHRLLSISLFL
jgi:RhoGEF domain